MKRVPRDSAVREDILVQKRHLPESLSELRTHRVARPHSIERMPVASHRHEKRLGSAGGIEPAVIGLR
jgi:hypothetical protein